MLLYTVGLVAVDVCVRESVRARERETCHEFVDDNVEQVRMVAAEGWQINR